MKAAPAKKRRVKAPVVVPEPPVTEPVSASSIVAELLQEAPAMPEAAASDMALPEVPNGPELSEAPRSLVDEEFIPQPDLVEAEATTNAAPEGEAAKGDAAQEDGDDTHDPDGKARKSLAQKVRNWLGRAA